MASPPQSQSAVPARPPGHFSAGCIAGLAVSAASLFLCAGLISVGVYSLKDPSLLPPSLQQAVENSSLLSPVAQPGWDADDWWTQRVLSQVYTVAVDAVVADPQVIEHLGDEVGPDFAAADLYDRTNTGPLDGGTETIAFDLLGAKGQGKVTVVVTGAGSYNGGMAQQIKFQEITVTLSDGSQLTIPPPNDEAIQIR
jgi:hypothetical protein